VGPGELVFGVFWEMLSFHVVHVCIGSDLFVQISGLFLSFRLLSYTDGAYIFNAFG
jgi:hypothetical protein